MTVVKITQAVRLAAPKIRDDVSRP